VTVAPIIDRHMGTEPTDGRKGQARLHLRDVRHLNSESNVRGVHTVFDYVAVPHFADICLHASLFGNETLAAMAGISVHAPSGSVRLVFSAMVRTAYAEQSPSHQLPEKTVPRCAHQ